MNITNEMINEIRNKVDIVSVISNYLPLTQRGKNYFGVCPFHDDHSPSMSVSPDKQIFTCFSCGATGNVFTFVADYEHIGFYDAVRLLGSKVGYNLGNSISKNKDKHADYYDIYNLSCKFYQNNLNTSLGKNAREYLEKRKIDNDTIKKFKIGLALPKVSLTDYLLAKKYSLKNLNDMGLSNDNGMDLFVNRIIFPLYDLEGNIVAFSGRIYNTKDSSKYINTKETVLFKKGTILYNYHNAKEQLKKNEAIIVMEGFMDVIRANTVGITNCVATMGTALTKQNANLLKKMANNIILCFDGDKAGEEATTSAINVFKEIDVVPKVVRLPEDLDPDEYILKYGEDSFKSKIDNPDNAVEFLMRLHKSDKNLNDLEDVAKYIDESIRELASSNDLILGDLTLNKMASEFNINYNVLKDKYDSLRNKEEKKEVHYGIKKEKLNQYDKASRMLIYYMLKDEKIINMVSNKVTFFPNQNIRVLANEIIYYYRKYKSFNVADFISYIADNQEVLILFKDIMTIDIDGTYTDEEIDDYISVINSYPVKKKTQELEKQMKEEKDPLKQAKILSEMLSLKGVKQ